TPGPEPRTPINDQTCPGDGTAIYTIAQSGSYYLTGNIDAGTLSAINITASSVSIDLMGFTLAGVATGQAGGYAPTGVDGVRIDNGTVRGFTTGVLLQGKSSRVERVLALSNTATGIRITAGGDVRDCRADSNDTGFDVTSGSLVACGATANTTY